MFGYVMAGLLCAISLDASTPVDVHGQAAERPSALVDVESTPVARDVGPDSPQGPLTEDERVRLWAPVEAGDIPAPLRVDLPQIEEGSWWTPGRILVVGFFASSALFGASQAWGRDRGDPESFRSEFNVLEGALLGVALGGVLVLGVAAGASGG